MKPTGVARHGIADMVGSLLCAGRGIDCFETLDVLSPNGIGLEPIHSMGRARLAAQK